VPCLRMGERRATTTYGLYAQPQTSAGETVRWTPFRDGWEAPEWRSFLGLREVFTLKNSVYHTAFPRSCVAVLICFAAKWLQQNGHVSLEIVFQHHFVYQVFTYGLGFAMVFRCNLAYYRWWEGRRWCEQMSSKWFDSLQQAISFDAFSEVSEIQHWEFRVQITGLYSLLHSQAMTELTHRDDIPWLTHHLENGKWLEAFYRRDLKDGVSQVILWIYLMLGERFQGHFVRAPIISRMYQELSSGLLGFHNAVMVQTTPFPFPFAQVISLTIFVLMVTFPLVAARYIEDLVLAMLFTWGSTFGYFLLSEVACEMEQPFGRDGSDLPLVGYQVDFDRSVSMLVGSVSYIPPAANHAFGLRIQKAIDSCNEDKLKQDSTCS